MLIRKPSLKHQKLCFSEALALLARFSLENRFYSLRFLYTDISLNKKSTSLFSFTRIAVIMMISGNINVLFDFFQLEWQLRKLGQRIDLLYRVNRVILNFYQVHDLFFLGCHISCV